MSSHDGTQKKRPPPINVPSLPAPWSTKVAIPDPSKMKNTGLYKKQQQGEMKQQQYNAGNASATNHRGSRPRENSSGKSPKEQNALHTSISSSRRSQIGTAGSDPDYKFSMIRFSDQSNRSATAMSDRIETRDEKTGRARIEARHEQKLFKMTGQLPPTPSTGAVDEDRIHIRSEDLRSQCHPLNRGNQLDREELAKSPKKTLFGNLRNAFNRTPHYAPPVMPSKAAQVFGTAPRDPNKTEMRPIKPSESTNTSMQLARSDTSRSLPDKIGNAREQPRYHKRSWSRRARHAHKPLHKGSRNFTSTDNIPPMPGENTRLKSISPPPPPAKDSPRAKMPPPMPSSPLRRTRHSEHLHETYEAGVDHIMKLRTPDFALSHSPFDTPTPAKSKMKPSSFDPRTRGKYTKAITGEPAQLHYWRAGGSRSTSPVTENGAVPSFTPVRGAHEIRRPSRANFPFAEGEPQSQNANVDPPLFPDPSDTDLGSLLDSSTGSIRMVYVGDGKDIDPNSSTGRLISATKEAFLPLGCDNTTIMVHPERELPIGEDHPFTPRNMGQFIGTPNTVGPFKHPRHGNLQPNGPEVVQTPAPKPELPFIQPQSNHTGPGSCRPTWQPHTPKDIEDHFFMTNEHLDVVGKTTWDLLEMSKQHHLETTNSKQGELVGLIKTQFEDIKCEVASLNEKAGGTMEKQDSVLVSLNKLFSYVTEDIAGVLAAHEKKAVAMETQVKELQKTVQTLQQWLEQKFTDMKPSFPTPSFPSPNVAPPVQRAQPMMAGYYGGAEYGHENQSPMPHLLENRNSGPTHDGHADQRVGHNSGYGPPWGTRHAYPGRISKEDRSPYHGNGAYHFAGQFGNGYMAGYSGYGFSPDASEQHSPYHQGPSK